MNFSVGMIGSGSMGRAHTYGYDRLNEFYDDVRVVKTVICSPHITAEKAANLGRSAYEAVDAVMQSDREKRTVCIE